MHISAWMESDLLTWWSHPEHLSEIQDAFWTPYAETTCDSLRKSISWVTWGSIMIPPGNFKQPHGNFYVSCIAILRTPSKLSLSFFFFIFKRFWWCCEACGILLSQPGSNPCSLQSPLVRVLTPGLPGKSHKLFSYLQPSALLFWWMVRASWRRAWWHTPVFVLGEPPWKEDPGGLQSMGLQRVRRDWATEHSTAQGLPTRRWW